MLCRFPRSFTLSVCVIAEFCIAAAGLVIVGMKSAVAADCGLGLGFVPATISASPPKIAAGESTVLSVKLGKPVWFDCSSGSGPISRIYNRRVVGLITLQIYSGDGQFAHYSYPSGFNIKSFFTYLNEGKFEAGGVGSAPVISGDPEMAVIGTAKVLFDQKLIHLPGVETETFKDRSVSILVFARPATVTVLPESDR